MNITINPDYILPKEFKSNKTKSNPYTKTNLRNWTKKEELWITNLKKKGLSNEEIAFCVDRSIASIENKIRRLRKRDGTYNEVHRDEKYKTNNKFVDIIKPKSVIDVYAGLESFYKNTNIKNVITNDKNKSANTDFNLDSFDFLCKMYVDGNKFDLVDLDPFGSAAKCFDLAIMLAKKGLIITLGDIHHRYCC